MKWVKLGEMAAHQHDPVAVEADDLGAKVGLVRLQHHADQQHCEDLQLREDLDPVQSVALEPGTVGSHQFGRNGMA